MCKVITVIFNRKSLCLLLKLLIIINFLHNILYLHTFLSLRTRLYKRCWTVCSISLSARTFLVFQVQSISKNRYLSIHTQPWHLGCCCYCCYCFCCLHKKVVWKYWTEKRTIQWIASNYFLQILRRDLRQKHAAAVIFVYPGIEQKEKIKSLKIETP